MNAFQSFDFFGSKALACPLMVVNRGLPCATGSACIRNLTDSMYRRRLASDFTLGASPISIHIIGLHMAERILRMKFPAGTRPEDRFKHVVHLLVQLIEDGLRDEYVRRKAVEIVNRAGIRGHDELEKSVQSLNGFNTMWFIGKDPINVEYFQTARRLIKDVESGRSAADCDDFVIVWGAMLGALGYEVAACIVDSNGDGMLNHVMGLVKTFAPTPQFGNKWIPCELIFTDFDLGQSVKVSQVYPLTADGNSTRLPVMMQKLAGLAGINNNEHTHSNVGIRPPCGKAVGYNEGETVMSWFRKGRRRRNDKCLYPRFGWCRTNQSW